MILKTFNSDIDKLTAKIGVFGKSFNVIFEAKNQRKIDIDDLIMYKGMSLDEAKKQVGNFWSYLYPKKEDLQKQLIDIDKMLPEIDNNKASKILEFIKSIENGTNEEIESLQALYDTGDKTSQWIAEYGQSTKDQIRSTEGVIKANQQARASALAHNEAIKAQTFSAKAGAVALKALSIAGNMLAMWAITKGLEFAVTGIDNLVHSAEHCKERVDSLMDSYNSALSEANNNAKTVDDLAERYEKLSEGVNNFGENVSLTTDEYAEYNKIVNQIAGMFPTMIQGYTDEGNAILSLKGNVEQLHDAYKEAQQEAYNLIIAGGNDIVENYMNRVNGENIPWFIRKNVFVNSRKNGAKESIDIIKKLTDVSSLEEFFNTYTKLYEEYSNLWSDKDISTLNTSLQSLGIKDIFALTEEDLPNIKKSAQTAIKTYQIEIDNALKGNKLLANAYLMTNEDYASLNDQCSTFASVMVNSMSSEIADGFENEVAVGRYVDDIVAAIKDNPDVQNAVINLFSIDTSNMPISEAKSHIDEYTKTIADAIGEDQLELKIRLGFDDPDDITNRLYRSVRAFADDHGMGNREILNSAEYQELLDIVDRLTYAEAELCLEAITGAESITDAIAKIKNALAPETMGYSSFEDAWSAAFASENESVKKLGETLLDLAAKGRLTTETFNQADSTNYFKNLGISAEEAVSKINKLADESQQLSSMSGSISKISEALGTKRDNKFVSADTLSGFDAEIRGLESWDHFQEVLGNVNSSYNDCWKAANTLASEWLNNSNFLAQLTEQNREYYASQLKAMGIENYEEILTYAYQLTTAKEALTQAGFDLSAAAFDEVQALISEGEYSALAQQQIWNLVLAKQISEGLALNTAADCENLAALAQNAGRISFQEYSATVSSYLQAAFASGSLSAQKYWSAMQSFLTVKKDSYDAAVSAVTGRIDREINTLKDRQDSIAAGYQSQIDSLEKQKELLQGANEERKRQLDLQKDLYDQERAHQQRTILQYSEDRGMHYIQDAQALRDAKTQVEDARLQIKIAEIEQAVTDLEEARDREKASLDGMILSLEHYRDQWNQISTAYEEAQENQLAAMILGQNWEADILGMRTDVLAAFTDNYIRLQQQIADAAWESANAQIAAQKEAVKGTDGTKGAAKAQIRNLAEGLQHTNGKAPADQAALTEETIITRDGLILTPVQPGDEMYELIQKYNTYLESIDGNLEKMLPVSMREQSSLVQEDISRVTGITIANSKNIQPLVNQNFHISLPNVTNSTSAEALLNDLQSIALKKYQVNW